MAKLGLKPLKCPVLRVIGEVLTAVVVAQLDAIGCVRGAHTKAAVDGLGDRFVGGKAVAAFADTSGPQQKHALQAINSAGVGEVAALMCATFARQMGLARAMHGVFNFMVTPFHASLKLNAEGLQKNILHHAAYQID